MADTTVKVLDDGPYVVTGSLDLHDGEGNPVPTDGTVALCRCGASSNKPFCDGSHSTAGFSSQVRAG